MTSGTRGTDTAVVLGGRFRLDGRIAVGGMGEVWAAKDLLLDREVAVKLLKDEYLEDPGFLARFQQEARHSAGLSHPGIATVYDYGEVNAAPYLVMELVRGEPLSAMLARSGRLPVAQALEIAAQTARALGAAHDAGVIHRDVKPGNILVCADGTVKVTDFGIARAIDGVPLTQTGTVIGTANYLSPEQAQGVHTTPASDLYSLGVVTYEMLAGVGPFAATNPVAVALAHVRDEPQPLPDEIPAAVRAVVLRALEKRPGDRYADAAAFAAAAEHAAAVAAGLLPPGALPADTAVVRRVEVPSEGTRLIESVPVAAAVGARARRRWWLLPVAVGVALLVTLAAHAMSADTKRAGAPGPSASSSPIAAQSAPTLPSAPTPATVVVPSTIIGAPYDQAAAAVRALGLNPARRNVVNSEARGIVVSTDPGPESPLKRGATVTLVTSSGPPAASTAPAIVQPQPTPKGKKKHHGQGD